MNAKELRIGNSIYKSLKSGNGRTIIDKIKAQDIVRIEENNGPYNYAPIALSDEIFLNRGFIKEIGLNGAKIYKKRFFYDSGFEDFIELINMSGNESNCLTLVLSANHTKNHFRLATEIDYLHQIENLYFALSNKEME